VVYFTYLTRQDPDSNPAVKLVRELTGVAKNRIIGIRKQGTENPDIRMTIEDFQADMEKSNKEKLATAQKSFTTAGEPMVKSQQDFAPMKQAMRDLKNVLGISEEEALDIYLGSITKSVMQIDIGEAANTNTATIEAAFGLSELNKHLGKYSAQRAISPISQQRILYDTPDKRVSTGLLKEGESFKAGTLEEELAQYLYNSWSQNHIRLDNLVLTYMERDEGNPVIWAIAKRMAKSAAKVGLQMPMFFLPGRAHSGIEGLMARAEKAFNISIVYTQADKTDNGNVDIGGITVNDATYIYGISNVIRMFLGGSRGIIFEVKNADQLKEIQTSIDTVMNIFDQMMKSNPVVTSNSAMTAEKTDITRLSIVQFLNLKMIQDIFGSHNSNIIAIKLSKIGLTTVQQLLQKLPRELERALGKQSIVYIRLALAQHGLVLKGDELSPKSLDLLFFLKYEKVVSFYYPDVFKGRLTVEYLLKHTKKELFDKAKKDFPGALWVHRIQGKSSGQA
jgi:hypothetical protein